MEKYPPYHPQTEHCKSGSAAFRTRVRKWNAAVARRRCCSNDILEENQKGQVPFFKKRKKWRFDQGYIKGRKQLMSWGGVHFAKLPVIASLRWHFHLRWWDGLSFIAQNGIISALLSQGNLTVLPLKLSAEGFWKDLCYGLSCVPTTPPTKIIHMLKA